MCSFSWSLSWSWTRTCNLCDFTNDFHVTPTFNSWICDVLHVSLHSIYIVHGLFDVWRHSTNCPIISYASRRLIAILHVWLGNQQPLDTVYPCFACRPKRFCDFLMLCGYRINKFFYLPIYRSTFGELDKLNPIIDDSDRGRMMDVAYKLMKNHDKMKTLDQFMEDLQHAKH